MRSKSLIAVATVAVLVALAGCSKDSSSNGSDTTVADGSTVECPTQAVVDDVNGELNKIGSGQTPDIVGAFATVGEYVPATLQSELDIWQEAGAAVLDAMDGIDLSKPDSEYTATEIAALEDAQAIIEDPAVVDAQAAIKAYFRDECPDIVFSEDSESTDTSERASGGSCPTPDEVAAIQAKADSANKATVDASVIATLDSIFETQATYLPPDLQDELALTRSTFIGAISQLEGLSPETLNDASMLSPEDQARVDGYLAAFDDPAFLKASEAVTDYFDTECDLSL